MIPLSHPARSAALAATVLLVPALLQGSTFKHITIDGSFTDWAGVPVAHVDPDDQTNATDYKSISVANDNDFLYIRFSLYRPSDPSIFLNNIFMDTDNSVSTGFGQRVGSEMLIQSGAGYDERGGGFNEGGVTGLNFMIAPQGVGTEFELRISRAATYDPSGVLVFGGSIINFVLEAETPNFVPVEFAPDTGGVNYEFAFSPSPATGSSVLVGLGHSWRYDDSGTDRGSDWLADGYDDSAWTSGQGFFGFTPTPGAYPKAIATALSGGKSAYYFRTHFNWSFDTAGILLVSSNYVSDGAVFFVNGQEVNRLRVPAGPVNFGTAASGSAAMVGTVEVLDFNPAVLVEGDNILQVELHADPTTAGEVVLGMSLTATDTLPVIITDPSQPADRQVTEGASTTFAATVIGSGTLTYQWMKEGIDIPGATASTYTIPVVLNTDAGQYSVRVGNGVGASQTTRAAKLTPLYISVSIADVALPQDATVDEGNSVTFASSVSGSGPITYQWFKNNAPIANANQASLEINGLTEGDAGVYSVQAKNRQGAPAVSRSATLVVHTDRQAPTLTAAWGSYNTVLVTFSEPVSEASASSKDNFILSGGVTVLSSARDAGNPSQVRLTTSSQTLFNRYTLSVSGVKDLFQNSIALNASAEFTSTIQVDGVTEDWADLAPVVEDADDSSTSLDVANVWVGDDENYLYVRLSSYDPGVFVNSYNNIFVDADDTRSTGYGFRVGSEMLIQGGSGYQEKNKGFNEGGIEGLDWLSAPDGPSSVFEFRISKKATYANDGRRVFASDRVAFLIETETTSYSTADVAPSNGWIAHTFRFPPPAELVVATAEGGLKISWVGSGTLESALTVSGPWVEVGGAASPMTLPTDEAHSFFRVVRNPAPPAAAH